MKYLAILIISAVAITGAARAGTIDKQALSLDDVATLYSEQLKKLQIVTDVKRADQESIRIKYGEDGEVLAFLNNMRDELNSDINGREEIIAGFVAAFEKTAGRESVSFKNDEILKNLMPLVRHEPYSTQ